MLMAVDVRPADVLDATAAVADAASMNVKLPKRHERSHVVIATHDAMAAAITILLAYAAA